MSDPPKKPPAKADASSKAHQRGAGRSGSAGSIGQELGGDLDFEPDALLDSLLSERRPESGSQDRTHTPPAVNPAGLPPKEPFMPAMSPKAPPASTRLAGEKPRDPSELSSEELARFEQPTLPDIQEDSLDELLDDDDEAATSFFQRSSEGSSPPPPVSMSPARGADWIPLEDEDSFLLDAPSHEEQSHEEQSHEAALGGDLTVDEGGPSADDVDALLAGDQEAADSAPAWDDDEQSAYEDDDGLRETLPPKGGSEAPKARSPSRGDRLSDSVPDAALGTAGDERPASTFLQMSGATDAFRQRAEWLELEAKGLKDPAAKGRALLMASELFAMLGDFSRARKAAGELHAVAPTLALGGRQLRWLAALDQDWKAVTGILEIETRAAPNEDARAHAANFSAEVYRVALGDQVSARRKLELAARVKPSDPRCHVAKLAEQLGQAPAPPRIRWPETPGLESLIQATEEVVRIRSGKTSDAPSTTLAVAWEEARRALAIRDPASALEPLMQLAGPDALGSRALWLVAALAAHSEETRKVSIAALSKLIEGGNEGLARSALAARAVEDTDQHALKEALFDDDKLSPAFDEGDRLALGALTGLGDLQGDDPSGDAELAPLLVGIELASVGGSAEAPGDEGGQASVGLTAKLADSGAQGEFELGRALATFAGHRVSGGDHDTLEPALGSLPAGSKVAKLMRLDAALAKRDADAVAATLSSWPSADTSKAERLETAPVLAAALTLELAGKPEAAASYFERARAASPTREAPVRALQDVGDPAHSADLLEELAGHCTDPHQTGLLHLEAALKRAADPAGCQEALQRAASALPDLPLTYLYGEHQARLQGDADLLLRWLRERRETTGDDMDRAFDLVREALLVAESDMSLGRDLLAEACSIRPNDIALRELHERLGDATGEERGQWRDAVAAELGGDAAYALLAEATLEHERFGDRERAARSAKDALALRPGNAYAAVRRERLAVQTGDCGQLADALMAQTRAEEDPIIQREIYERLSELDEARGQDSSATLWQTAILEGSPKYLPALRRLEHQYIQSGRHEELVPIAEELSRALDPAEAEAHAIWSAQYRILNGDWTGPGETIARAAASETPSLWTLRARRARALAESDNETCLRIDLSLIEKASSPLDLATLSLRAAEASARLERLEAARALLQRALHEFPGHPVAITTLADILEAMQAFEDAAEALEAAATHSQVAKYQLDNWFQAAVLWQDRVGNDERAIRALEEAVERDVCHDQAFLRLQGLYGARHETKKLAELLDKRLAHSSDPDERVRIEVLRGQALIQVGEKQAAKAALRAALDDSPEHAGALAALANLCYDEGDWEGAEQALIRLARHAPNPEEQAGIYRKLGNLYDDQLPNPARAELAYEEVLKREPGDRDARERLLGVYARLQNPEKALATASALLEGASTPIEKRDATLRLAETHERVAGDPKEAQDLLAKARREFAYDSIVLRATAEFHRRQGDERGLALMLDRTANEARRALGTGRFTQGFFQVLSTIMELRGAADDARVAEATLAALEGRTSAVTGAGESAGNPNLNEPLAPSALAFQLRALFSRAGDIFDDAFPIDLKTLRAAPLPQQLQQEGARIQELGNAFGLRPLEVYLSPSLGLTCMPVCSTPARILMGEALLKHENAEVKEFLVLRALKLVQARMSILARTAPVDLWPVVGGFLSLFARDWQPQGADPEKVAQAAERLKAAFPPALDGDIPTLALEVVGSIGNRASQLGALANQWGSRTALLAIGDPSTAFLALALAAGRPEGPPPEGDERLRWIVRNPEARDVAVFSVDQQYLDVRRASGL